VEREKETRVTRLAESEHRAIGTETATGESSPRRVSAVLLFFAAARQAAGRRQDHVEAGTVAEAMETARTRYGDDFAAVLDRSRVWVNGEPAAPDRRLFEGDEIAVLPPVSGGSDERTGSDSW
jgi:sulfur-carrier protein